MLRQGEKMSSRCPICCQEMDDRRHVSVECFYKVDEVVPEAEESKIFVEVNEESTYFGYTRRYKDGTRDEFSSTPDPVKENLTHLNVEQVPIGDIRLLENTIYTLECCKSCRADFLDMLKKWKQGEFVHRETNDPEANIPIRENGATRMITEEEWKERRAKDD